MIFNTYWFLTFAAVTVAIFWLLRKPVLRLPFLGAACLVFHYHFAGPAGILPVLALGLLSYALALSRNRLVCAIGITVNVLALCFYKYVHFVSASLIVLINPEWAEAVDKAATGLMPGAPPLAISFFAFEFVHYLYEVRKGSAPLKNPLHFLLFALFFPTLVAGPIKRYAQFIPSLEEGARSVGVDDLAAGLRRIALGFLKKVVIADNLTLAINHYGPQFETMSLTGRWFLLTLIALRILMDFSGYSDIAIGLARLFGVKIPENFNWPYAARNIQDFWQRWHISLSSWIRDYVYIPLGGNRHGTARKVFNGLLAFALCGLWHGPAWNFVVWGLYHGVGLAICGNYASIPVIGPRLEALLSRSPKICWVMTQGFAWIGWLIFFYPLPRAWVMIKLLFTP